MATSVYKCQLTAQNGNKIQLKVSAQPDSTRHDTHGRIYDVHPDGGGLTVPIGCMITELGETRDEDNRFTDRYVEICNVKNLTSRNKIKGIGTLLLECALAQSIACGRKGHLRLNARRDSHLFFYSLGFRAYENHLNETMEQHFKKAQEEKCHGSVQSLGKFPMYLSQEANQLEITDRHLQFQYQLEDEIEKLRDEQKLESVQKELIASKRNFNKEKFSRVAAERQLDELKQKHQTLLSKSANDKDFKDVIKKRTKKKKRVSFAEPEVTTPSTASSNPTLSHSAHPVTLEELLKKIEDLINKINQPRG